MYAREAFLLWGFMIGWFLFNGFNYEFGVLFFLLFCKCLCYNGGMGPSYNNSFGVFSNNGAGQVGIVSSPSSVPEKSKTKKLFIVFCVLFVLLIIGGIAAFVLLNPKGGKGGGSSKGSYSKEFNLYANYLLYGEESDKAIGEVDIDEEYYIDKNWSNEEYLSKLSEIYDSYFSAIIENEEKSVENFLLYSSKSRLDFLKNYKMIKTINVSAAYGRYTELGKEGLIEYLRGIYSDVDLDNQFISSLADDEFDLLNVGFEGNEGNIDSVVLVRKVNDNRAEYVEKTINGLKEQCEEMEEDLYEKK